jgi:hypothetical protein
VISEVKDTAVTFCELVEHPCGHDGGEFPQYHTYGIRDDGSVYYATDFPDCPNDAFTIQSAFGEESAEDYTQAATKQDALLVLTKALEEQEKAVEVLRKLVYHFSTDVEFETEFGDGNDNTSWEYEDWIDHLTYIDTQVMKEIGLVEKISYIAKGGQVVLRVFEHGREEGATWIPVFETWTEFSPPCHHLVCEKCQGEQKG